MPPRRPKRLAPNEWKVMRVVWRQKACASRDVCAETNRRYGWATSTTKTVLRRLVEKGYLATQQVGNSFLYRPARPAVGTLLAAADSLLENALEGTTGPVLAHMIRKSKLSEGEMAELRSLLDNQGAKKEG